MGSIRRAVRAASLLLLFAALGCEERGVPAAGQPRPAPAFTLPDLDGNAFKLWDLRGKTVVIGFWDLLCEPCVLLPPELNRIRADHPEQEVVVLGIEVGGHDTEEVRAWETGHGVPADYPQLVGAEENLARIFGAPLVPSVIVVAPDGSVDATLHGFHTADVIAEAIAHTDRGRWVPALQIAPGFIYPDLDGEVVRLTDLRGRTVVIDFWATWCAECILQPPELNRLVERHRESGELVVLGVEIGGAQEREIRQWGRQFGAVARYPQLVGASGGVATLFGVSAVPSTVVVAPDGSIDSVMVGYHDAEEIEASIRHLLEPGSSQRRPW